MTRTRWVLLVCVALGGVGLALAGISTGQDRASDPRALLNPPMPTKPHSPAYLQPINFSHKLHAGQLGIDCAYCHSNVDKSPIANIPNVSTCMNCHTTVKTDSPEIKKLTAYYTEGRTIPWVHVHWLPDHVYFSHKRHVKKGIQCQTCHGPVATMEHVYRVVDLKMGFCVSCHKANNANMVANNAGLDCWTCHR